MADVEPDLLDWLGDLAYTVTSTPADLETRLADGTKVLRIQRIGGGSDADNDYPMISVQSYAARSSVTPRAAWDLDTAVEERFFNVATYGPQLVGKTLIESPDKTSGPVERPWPNAAVTVVESIYRFTTRR